MSYWRNDNGPTLEGLGEWRDARLVFHAARGYPPLLDPPAPPIVNRMQHGTRSVRGFAEAPPGTPAARREGRLALAASRRLSPLCGIDIGSDRVRAVLARVPESLTETRETPVLEVLAVGEAESGDSVQCGEVIRQRDVTEAVRRAVEETERAAGVEVGSAFVSVGSRYLRGINSWATIPVPEPRERIRESDVHRAVMAAVPRGGGMPGLRPPYELLHALPQEFRVDNRDPTNDPIGRTGEGLACHVHLVSCPGDTLRRLEEAVNGAGIRTERLVSAPLAVGYGVLDPADFRKGVIVLDIGAMTTVIAVFRRGVLWHSDLMPSGGQTCTRELAAVLGTSFVHAEHAKRRCGMARAEELPEAVSVEVQAFGGGSPIRCPPDLLADVLRRRAESDLTEVRDRLRRGLGNPPGTVVLTGGGANLDGLSDLARLVFGGDVEIRGPRELAGQRDAAARLHFATAVGLCRYGAIQRRRSPRSAL